MIVIDLCTNTSGQYSLYYQSIQCKQCKQAPLLSLSISVYTQFNPSRSLVLQAHYLLTYSWQFTQILRRRRPLRLPADLPHTMDQTHVRALEALQPFIHLANSNSATSPRFIANLITNATSSPQTYVFAELLETETVQALASPDTPAEYQAYLKLLQIFAWGTWQEYQGRITSSPSTIISKIVHLVYGES